jgi:hypothetical protein
MTTKARRPELPDTIEWLVLDGRSTLRRYFAGPDDPTDLPSARTSA